ncbi:MAG: hypothetical protein LBP55_09260 [Candidatus Adiutrix sp.]|nr:hypothetical protein [Candidatus Adiutrix sp.]
MRPFPALLAALLIFQPAPLPAAPAGPEAFIKDGQVVVVSGEETLTMPSYAVAVKAVANSDLNWASIPADQGQSLGLAEGLYLFTAEGAVYGLIPAGPGPSPQSVSLSPTGRILIVDPGRAPNRNLSLYSYPELGSLGSLAVFQRGEEPPLLWTDKGQALFTSLDLESRSRPCDYAPCGPTSVKFFNPAEGKITTLLAGDPTCDYTVVSVAGGQLTATKLCLAAATSWRFYPEGQAGVKVTARLPE